MAETLPPAEGAQSPQSKKAEIDLSGTTTSRSILPPSDAPAKAETPEDVSAGGYPQKSVEGNEGAAIEAAPNSSSSETEPKEIGEGEVSDSDGSDAHSSVSSEKEEDLVQSLTASELLQRGKAFFKKGEFEASADTFSRAVEKKIAEVGGQEFSSSLGVYYLWFGDALLSKEEQTDDLFAAIPQHAASAEETGTSASASQTQLKAKQQQAVEGSDEELAFQMLELAKQCLSRALKYTSTQRADSPRATQIPKSEEAVDKNAFLANTDAAESKASSGAAEGSGDDATFDRAAAASDLAFAFMRLGDMQLMNNNFDEAASAVDGVFATAAKEYSESIAVREAYGLPEASLLAPTLSLAQAIFFSGKVALALDKFKICESIGRRILSGELPLPEGTTRKAVEETLEDLKIQTSDIERQLQEQPQQAQQKGSQCEAKDLINKTSSDFDKPVLAHTGAVKRVVVTPSGQQRQEGEPKKRKIDLRQLKQQEAQGSSQQSSAVQACNAADAEKFPSEERENKIHHQQASEQPEAVAAVEVPVCSGAQENAEKESSVSGDGRATAVEATKTPAEWSGDSALSKRRSLASSGGAL